MMHKTPGFFWKNKQDLEILSKYRIVLVKNSAEN